LLTGPWFWLVVGNHKAYRTNLEPADTLFDKVVVKMSTEEVGITELPDEILLQVFALLPFVALIQVSGRRADESVLFTLNVGLTLNVLFEGQIRWLDACFIIG
jgi:hypothetical protein